MLGEDTLVQRGYQPLCFTKDAFGRQNFKVDSFISTCRTRVPLESVLSDLKEYSVSLDNELLELINKDYADFVSLSSNLVGIDKVVGDLRKPLQGIKEEVLSLKSALVSSSQRLQTKLNERRDVRDKKACLELFLNVSSSIEKIEKLLGIDTTTRTEIRFEEDEQTSNTVERVASEFNQLNYYVSRGKQFQFVRNMEPRIAVIANHLSSALERLFREGITTKNANILSNCLRTYAAVDQVPQAQNLFRQWIVAPEMQKIITPEAVEQGLSAMYRAILTFVEEKGSLLLSLTHKSVRGFNFLGESIWPEIATLIIKKIPNIFTPAFPAVFHKNFKCTMEFLDQFEQFCQTRDELEGIRNHVSYQEFMKKWNLAIYFQLRFQDIANKLEESFAVEQVTGQPKYALHSTKILWECLMSCWSADIYLPLLFHRFFKLSLQLVIRYKTWILANLNKETPSEGSVPSKGDSILTSNTLLYVSYDVENTAQELKTHYTEHVLKEIPDELKTIARERYHKLADQLCEVLPLIGQFITGNLISKSTESLLLVRGITSTYRMTNKPPPTKPSYYPEKAVAPLEEFFNSSGAFLSQSNRTQWTLQVITAVTEKFLELTTDLLKSVEHSEAVRKKMVKKSYTSTTNQELTDLDKIYIQLYLDVDYYGKLLPKFGMNQQFGPYQQLLESVQMGRKLWAELHESK